MMGSTNVKTTKNCSNELSKGSLIHLKYRSTNGWPEKLGLRYLGHLLTNPRLTFRCHGQVKTWRRGGRNLPGFESWSFLRPWSCRATPSLDMMNKDEWLFEQERRVWFSLTGLSHWLLYSQSQRATDSAF